MDTLYPWLHEAHIKQNCSATKLPDMGKKEEDKEEEDDEENPELKKNMGTSEGAKKTWDTRGRGRNEEPAVTKGGLSYRSGEPGTKGTGSSGIEDTISTIMGNDFFTNKERKKRLEDMYVKRKVDSFNTGGDKAKKQAVQNDLNSLQAAIDKVSGKKKKKEGGLANWTATVSSI